MDCRPGSSLIAWRTRSHEAGPPAACWRLAGGVPQASAALATSTAGVVRQVDVPERAPGLRARCDMLRTAHPKLFNCLSQLSQLPVPTVRLLCASKLRNPNFAFRIGRRGQHVAAYALWTAHPGPHVAEAPAYPVVFILAIHQPGACRTATGTVRPVHVERRVRLRAARAIVCRGRGATRWALGADTRTTATGDREVARITRRRRARRASVHTACGHRAASRHGMPAGSGEWPPPDVSARRARMTIWRRRQGVPGCRHFRAGRTSDRPCGVAESARREGCGRRPHCPRGPGSRPCTSAQPAMYRRAAGSIR